MLNSSRGGADKEEAAPNGNFSTDTVALSSAILGGGEITDEEGEAPKDNLIAEFSAQAEEIASGVVAVIGPREK